MKNSKYSVKQFVFWGALMTLLLAVIVSWQLADKREGNYNPLFSWLNYPLEAYQLASNIEKTNRQQIDEVLQPYVGDSFWDLPLLEIQSELMRLDWIVRAQVSRSWPNLLTVAVTEQKAVARWGDNGLVNQSGEVFYPSTLEGYEDLVVLDGDLQFAVKVAERFANLMPRFSQHDLWLESMVLLDEQVWELQVFEGPLLRFSDKLWEQQIERFLLAYPKLEASMINSAAYYDLRYSNGFVMKQKTPVSDSLLPGKNDTSGKASQDDNNHREG